MSDIRMKPTGAENTLYMCVIGNTEKVYITHPIHGRKSHRSIEHVFRRI